MDLRNGENVLVNNNVNKRYNKRANIQYKPELSFQAFRIKDTDTVVNNFLNLPKDKAVLRLEESLNLSDETNVFHKVKDLLKDPIKTVIDACKEGFDIKIYDIEGDFEVAKKMRSTLTNLGNGDKNDNFLKTFIKGIAGSADDVSEEVQPIVLKDNVKPKAKESVKSKGKSIEELAEEADDILSRKGQYSTDNAKPRRSKKTNPKMEALKEIRKEIRLASAEMKQKIAIVNKFWLAFRKQKRWATDDGSLYDMKELSSQKDIALKEISSLERELKKLSVIERKLLKS